MYTFQKFLDVEEETHFDVDQDTYGDVEEFISSCTNLSDTLCANHDLQTVRELATEMYDTFKEQKYISNGFKYFLQSDYYFCDYFSNKKTLDEYLAGTENMIKDVFIAIINFFKKICSGLWDFIKKIFGLNRTIAEKNDKNIRSLK